MRLVDGERPGKAQRKLPEGARHVLNDFLGRLIVSVTACLPRDGLDLVHLLIDFDPNSLVVEFRDAGDRAVDPPFVGIVAQQNHFRAGLQKQRRVRWMRGFAELTADAGLVGFYVGRERIEIGHVNPLRGGVGGREDDKRTAFAQCADGMRALVQHGEVLLCHVSVSDSIKDFKERFIALTEDVIEL